MYSPDMDLTEIRGLAGWIVNLETGEMFPTTTEAAKAAGTSRSVVLDHVKNKVKPQNKRFSYVRDWDGKVGRLVDLNVQMICLETDTIYHSYDEICAAIWSDGYGETRKEIVQKVGDAIRHGCLPLICIGQIVRTLKREKKPTWRRKGCALVRLSS